MLRFPISQEKNGKHYGTRLHEALPEQYVASICIWEVSLKFLFKYPDYQGVFYFRRNSKNHEIKPVRYNKKYVQLFNILKEVGC